MPYPVITPYEGQIPIRDQGRQALNQNTADLLSYIPPFVEDVNEAGAYIDGVIAGIAQDRKSAETAATSAESNASVAISAANFKGSWADLTGSLSVPSSIYHAGGYWQLLNDVADITTSEPGVSADWASINTVNFWSPISTSQALDPSRYYAVDFTAGPLTLTLPAAPATNDFVQFYTSAGEATDSIIARNGGTIMGLSEDLTINYDAKALHLVYNGTDWRVVR